MKPSLKKGFSIIELIFTIVVIGIIASVAVPKLMDSRSSALVTTIKQDISTITTSIQSYYMIHNKIDKISDSVNINSKTWIINDLNVEFISDDKRCVIIKIDENKLEVIIDQESSTMCEKLFNSGVQNASYELY